MPQNYKKIAVLMGGKSSEADISLRTGAAIVKGLSEAGYEAIPVELSKEDNSFTLPPWCESILGLKVEAVQGNQVSLEWMETSGCLWEWWHDPGVPLAFPVESACS